MTPREIAETIEYTMMPEGPVCRVVGRLRSTEERVLHCESIARSQIDLVAIAKHDCRQHILDRLYGEILDVVYPLAQDILAALPPNGDHDIRERLDRLLVLLKGEA